MSDTTSKIRKIRFQLNLQKLKTLLRKGLREGINDLLVKRSIGACNYRLKFLRSRGLILILLCLSLGCANNKPSAKTQTHAANTVGILFTIDGITVYRFGDDGNYHYFAVHTGNRDTITLTNWDESCGNNCSKHVEEALMLMAAK